MSVQYITYCSKCKESTDHYNGMCKVCSPLRIQEYQALTYGSGVPMPDRRELSSEYKRAAESTKTPNLPTEDELKAEINNLLDEAVFHEGEGPNGSGGEFWILPEGAELGKDNHIPLLDEVMKAIHHYATKRELEARIDELQKIDGDVGEVWTYLDSEKGTPEEGFGRSLSERIAELKAQKEQENK